MCVQTFLSWVITMNTTNPHWSYIFNPFNLMGKFKINSKPITRKTLKDNYTFYTVLSQHWEGNMFCLWTQIFPSLFFSLPSLKGLRGLPILPYSPVTKLVVNGKTALSLPFLEFWESTLPQQIQKMPHTYILISFASVTWA